MISMFKIPEVGLDKFGVSVALLTPFTDSGRLDAELLGAHARQLMDRGADSVTLFGTTGEGASVEPEERRSGVEAVLSAGCPSSAVVLGACATSIGAAAQQISEGLRYGITEFLLPPPFYFGGVGEAGLFDWHMELFARVPPPARFILYHIPQVIGVGLPARLVGRLIAAAPDRLRAIKDSSGDMGTARAFLDFDALPVLVGDERLLHRAVALGAAGAISGMANLYPERLKRIVETAEEDADLSSEVSRVVSVPVIPALKAMIASRSGDKRWERLRPPFAPLDAKQRAAVFGGEEAMV